MKRDIARFAHDTRYELKEALHKLKEKVLRSGLSTFSFGILFFFCPEVYFWSIDKSGGSSR